MGFCLFNNVAIAALHAKEAMWCQTINSQALGVERIAIIDWDVHHGNGTQQAFYEDNSVLFISIHQDALYPCDTGKLEELGKGDGLGYNFNVPLPPGTGYGGYREAFKRVVLPGEHEEIFWLQAVESFQPQLILVSSGFDAAALDPLSHMMLSSEIYREFTEQLVELAGRLCKGRIVMCHEGGYSPELVPFCGLAVVEALSGNRMDVVDPFLEEISSYAYQELQEHQNVVISAAEANVKRFLLDTQ